jgi:pre-mRNA-splicing factor CWC22
MADVARRSTSESRTKPDKESSRNSREAEKSKEKGKRKHSASSSSGSYSSTDESEDESRKKTLKSHVQKVDTKKQKKHKRRSSSSSSSDSEAAETSRKDRKRSPDRNRRRRSPSYERRRDDYYPDRNYTSYYDVGSTKDRNRKRSRTPSPPKQQLEPVKPKKDLLTSKTGGAYIPPAKLRMMQAEITDKSSEAYQRISWEALKKSIHGFINKINVDNIGIVTRELLKENIVRGRGLLCRSIIQAQAASPTFTHVYAALVSVINSKFPNIGELLLQRLVLTFRRGFRRNDKTVCVTASKFIAHLVNQRVAHEILALEILTLLVETPTDDSVEVAIAFLKECGQKLTEVTGKGVNAIFEMLKNILHEGRLEKRVQYMIEVVFQVRKDGFKDHVPVVEQLELVEEDDQFTHLIMLEEATDAQDILSKFFFIQFFT